MSECYAVELMSTSPRLASVGQSLLRWFELKHLYAVASRACLSKPELTRAGRDLLRTDSQNKCGGLI